MDNKKSINATLLETVNKMIYSILRKEKLLQSEFHFGKVAEILPNYFLSVYVDGSDTAQKIKRNPDVTFNVNDQVIVIFINNDSKNKYVMSRILF